MNYSIKHMFHSPHGTNVEVRVINPSTVTLAMMYPIRDADSDDAHS